MSRMVENLVESFMNSLDTGGVDSYEKESHRVYLETKIEGYEERFKTLQEAINETIVAGDQNQSPFMFGYTEGMRRGLAFILNYQVAPFERPIVWHNDPAFEFRLRWIGANRIRVRRHITRLAWTMFSSFYRTHVEPLDVHPSFLERKVREIVNEIMKDFPTVSQIRAERKRLINLTGANYEEVTSTKTIESWWS